MSFFVGLFPGFGAVVRFSGRAGGKGSTEMRGRCARRPGKTTIFRVKSPCPPRSGGVGWWGSGIPGAVGAPFRPRRRGRSPRRPGRVWPAGPAVGGATDHRSGFGEVTRFGRVAGGGSPAALTPRVHRRSWSRERGTPEFDNDQRTVTERGRSPRRRKREENSRPTVPAAVPNGVATASGGRRDPSCPPSVARASMTISSVRQRHMLWRRRSVSPGVPCSDRHF